MYAIIKHSPLIVMYRAVYRLLGWEYHGKREQEQIRKATRQKYLVLQQLKNSHNLFKIKSSAQPWVMGILVDTNKKDQST